MVRKIKRIKFIILAAVIAAAFSLGGCDLSGSTSLHEYWDARYAEFINYNEKDENGEYLKEKGVRIYGLTEEGKKQKYLTLPKEIGGWTKITLMATPGIAWANPADLGEIIEGITFEGTPIITQSFFNKAYSLRWIDVKEKQDKPLREDIFSIIIIIYRQNELDDFQEYISDVNSNGWKHDYYSRKYCLFLGSEREKDTPNELINEFFPDFKRGE